MDFLKQLKKDAFDAISIDNHQADLHGWIAPAFFTTVNSFLDTYKTEEPITVVEVGTWKGLSAYTMANILKAHNKNDSNIICIDTWLGAPEFWTWGFDDLTRGKSLNKIHGYPSVFNTFTKNMKVCNHHDMIAPLPLPSSEAIHVLKHYDVKADIIYIDGSHEYESVKQDLANYWSILKPGGLMFGDDYMSTWPGVVKAVTEFPKMPTISGVVWSFKNE